MGFLSAPPTRDEVFVSGGQPTITYVDRSELDIERQFAKCVAAPNQIVTIAGSTKSGKTVLCRKVLGKKQYIWVEGGQFKNAGEVWGRICHELNVPLEITATEKSETTGEIGADIPLVLSASGSQLLGTESERKYKIDSIAAALKHLLERKIILVIDDFHYPDPEAQKEFLRNVKGAVFSGLKVILLSASHRAFDVTKLEPEFTGRFSAVIVPEWSEQDLRKIAERGFSALNVNCSENVVSILAHESQGSPFLMQKFCWEICYAREIERRSSTAVSIPQDMDLNDMFARIAKESGMPVYQRLVAGPQSRKDRMKRPLVAGGDADIYQATLLAIARSSPNPVVSYEDIRGQLNTVLADQVPQKHEVTSALKQLATISKSMGADVGIDWDESRREVNISDPYLRFFLRWQIKEMDLTDLIG